MMNIWYVSGPEKKIFLTEQEAIDYVIQRYGIVRGQDFWHIVGTDYTIRRMVAEYV